MTEPTDEAPATEPPARRRFLLARLAEAVRRQDWFTVLVEIAVVVLGIVIGFQVTAWGQSRSDRAKEQAYLRQLSADLLETERAVDRLTAQMVPLERAPRRLAQAHYLPEPPPRDSVIAWASAAPVYFSVRPVLATAEALVSTGDLALVQDDSLRVEIAAYLESSRRSITQFSVWEESLVGHTSDYVKSVDIARVFAEAMGPAALDSLDRADHWMVMVPPGVEVAPVDVDAIVRDDRLHRLLTMMVADKDNMGINRREFRQRAEALRARVEGALAP